MPLYFAASSTNAACSNCSNLYFNVVPRVPISGEGTAVVALTMAEEVTVVKVRYAAGCLTAQQLLCLPPFVVPSCNKLCIDVFGSVCVGGYVGLSSKRLSTNTWAVDCAAIEWSWRTHVWPRPNSDRSTLAASGKSVWNSPCCSGSRLSSAVDLLERSALLQWVSRAVGGHPSGSS